MKLTIQLSGQGHSLQAGPGLRTESHGQQIISASPANTIQIPMRPIKIARNFISIIQFLELNSFDQT